MALTQEQMDLLRESDKALTMAIEKLEGAMDPYMSGRVVCNGWPFHAIESAYNTARTVKEVVNNIVQYES